MASFSKSPIDTIHWIVNTPYHNKADFSNMNYQSMHAVVLQADVKCREHLLVGLCMQHTYLIRTEDCNVMNCFTSWPASISADALKSHD